MISYRRFRHFEVESRNIKIRKGIRIIVDKKNKKSGLIPKDFYSIFFFVYRGGSRNFNRGGGVQNIICASHITTSLSTGARARLRAPEAIGF